MGKAGYQSPLPCPSKVGAFVHWVWPFLILIFLSLENLNFNNEHLLYQGQHPKLGVLTLDCPS